MSIFFTSFERKWKRSYVGSSMQFLMAMILLGIKEPGRTLDLAMILDIIFKSSCYCGFMGSITYFIRYLMTMTFMF